MLIKQAHLQKIKSGEVFILFRKWKSPRVKRGSLIKTSIGQIRIEHILKINQHNITEKDTIEAGFNSISQLRDELNSQKIGNIYKIEVKYHSPDPRIELREKSNLSAADIEQIKLKLDRLDKYSKSGNWTRSVLRAIQENPKLRAKDLATKLGKEKDWLKLNIRKLKNIGLTISHEQGYTLSPRGIKYLKMIRK